MKSTEGVEKSKSVSKKLQDLFEATKIATENNQPTNLWDDDLVTKVVEIFETHSVRSIKVFNLS